MIGHLIQVAVGGAVGASLRWLIGLWIVRSFGHGFPVAVLSANVLGSFLLGVFVVVAAHRGLTHLSPLIVTGLFGGFTTFSAFSLETFTLFERGEIGQAALYVFLSVSLAVGSLVLGIYLARSVLV
ncbi:MAG: fluoride efflux transporter CrcB [Pseudomonadota bacterium]